MRRLCEEERSKGESDSAIVMVYTVTDSDRKTVQEEIGVVGLALK
jgi:hypothetical protein